MNTCPKFYMTKLEIKLIELEKKCQNFQDCLKHNDKTIAAQLKSIDPYWPPNRIISLVLEDVLNMIKNDHFCGSINVHNFWVTRMNITCCPLGTQHLQGLECQYREPEDPLKPRGAVSIGGSILKPKKKHRHGRFSQRM